MSILAFQSSPRQNGNSTGMLRSFIQGATDAGKNTETLMVEKLDIKNCRGCLKCNLIKRCAIRNDDWHIISHKILTADTLVFSAPVYFHHLPAALKKIIDRFRSFMHVQILENGLKHTPWNEWQKKIVLLLALGSPSKIDARPIVDVFNFICNKLGAQNQLYTFIASRVAVANQVLMNENQLNALYPKLQLPLNLVHEDYQRNQRILQECYELGKKI